MNTILELTSEESDYRVILNRAFALRCKRNSKYSLRAYARDLNLSPASLSEVLKGKQGLSQSAAERIGKYLGLSIETHTVFLAMVAYRHSRSVRERTRAYELLKKQSQIGNAFVLKEDVFELVAQWHHFALLEMLRYRKSNLNAKTISKKLGISLGEYELAIDRLERLELIRIENGRAIVLKGMVISPSGISSEAIRESHRQILSQAVSSLEAQSIEERDFSALVFSMDSNRMAEAKEMLKKFRRKFLRTFELREENAEVYCLSSQFFGLTKHDRTH